MYTLGRSAAAVLRPLTRCPAVPALVARARGPRKEKELEARPQMTHQYSAVVALLL